MQDLPWPEGPRLLGYARVSTDDQDLTLQRQALIKHGVDPRLIWEEHISGARLDRPQLGWLLASMKREDTIVVWKLDRLGRSLSGILQIVEKMDKEGVNLVSITETLDTRTPMGRFSFHLLASLAQFERDLIAERTKEGIAAKKAAGEWRGPKHSIKDYPERRAMVLRWIETGEAYTISAPEALARLNKLDGPEITTNETWNGFKRKGFKGIDG